MGIRTLEAFGLAWDIKTARIKHGASNDPGDLPRRLLLRLRLRCPLRRLTCRLRPRTCRSGLRRLRTGYFVRFLEPFSHRWFDLVTVPDLNDVRDLGGGDAIHAPNPRRLERPAEEHAHLEEVLLRPHEEVAGLPREHDRVVRGVDPLVSEGGRRCRAAAPRPPADPLTGPGSTPLRWSSSSRAPPPHRSIACSGSTLDRPCGHCKSAPHSPRTAAS